ncbi:MAG: 2-hydroxymuconate tautomerase [Alphaproteobacteria bacterium]
MPYVNVKILQGATRDQKKGLVEDITNSLVERMGKKADTIHIVIDEIADENWGYSGMLTDDYKKIRSQ